MRSRPLLVVGLLVSSGCGLVLEAPAGRDAGADASADGGRPGDDARVSDLDASTLDAAMPEADAARLDAPLPMLDAFVPDARMPDAFVPDAFVPDAFVPDAYAPLDAYAPDAFAPPAELIAHYPFHGVDDMTGRGHTLAIAGLAFSGRIAAFSWASSASTPDAADLDDVQAISLWVRPAVLPTGGVPATLVDSQGRFMVRIGATQLVCANGAGLAFMGSAPLEVGAWLFVACSFSGASISAFVGGVGTYSGSGGSASPAVDGPLVLGRTVSGEQPFQGAMADVRIWRRAPTVAELGSLAATPP